MVQCRHVSSCKLAVSADHSLSGMSISYVARTDSSNGLTSGTPGTPGPPPALPSSSEPPLPHPTTSPNASNPATARTLSLLTGFSMTPTYGFRAAVRVTKDEKKRRAVLPQTTRRADPATSRYFFFVPSSIHCTRPLLRSDC